MEQDRGYLPKADQSTAGKSERAKKEEAILEFWNKEKIFEKILKRKSPKGEFVFYDGPPFATGLPHYGHLLAGTLKDMIPRFKTMQGYHVRRQWGWDCHGLPIENLIEQELGLKHKKEIIAYGIDKFNEKAKQSVLRYEAEWKEIVPRMARWINMEDSYKTLDAKYTESVWWSFKTLYDKGLVYEGFKSMHVCPRCETPLAASEVTLNYKDVTDISVIAKFELVDNPGIFLLAWTTTPWTLPGNVALAVAGNSEYVSVLTQSGIKYVLAKNKLSVLKEEYRIEKTFQGKDLAGKKYKPLFDYYLPAEASAQAGASRANLKNRENGWKVYAADFVSTEEGTGIVHVAPAFGEDDMSLGRKYNLPFIQHVGIDGRFKSEVKDFAGLPVKIKSDDDKTRLATDILILKNLLDRGLLFAKEKITHAYPLCWRCDTPLINYATSSWFVAVEKLKKKLLEENNKILWVPEHMKSGRFGKWLLGARDWAVSRTRYWGAPIPAWKCDSSTGGCGRVEVLGSLEDIKKRQIRSGNTYFMMRHGEAESNVKNFISANAEDENHLTDKGKKEVSAAARKLKGRKIDLIFTSPFMRTKESASIVAETLAISSENVLVDDRLHETYAGIFSGKNSSEYHAFFANPEEYFTKIPPGGKNLTELKQMVGDFLYDVERRHENKNILIVSHQYPLWLMRAAAEGLNISESAKMKEQFSLQTGEVRELKFAPIPHNAQFELDYHRPFIDDIVFLCSCGGKMRQTQEVFDCWYESGSMPYAQFHYPFENKQLFKKNFPADFIAEGLDQTRGWFYNMLVLSVGLFGKSAFGAAIVNGLVLAEDGQKMSKKLKNYPDPMDIANKYGADALRYYLLASPIVHGENLNFSEKGVAEAQSKVLGRLSHVVSFWKLYAPPKHRGVKDIKSKNTLDLWIMSRLNELIRAVTEGLESYEVDKALRSIGDFVDDLSVWYIRRSRERFKSDTKAERDGALATTRFVLETLAKITAPFTPFIAEDIWRAFGNKGSVHLEHWPKPGKIHTHTLQEMATARRLVSLALEERSRNNIKVRQPLSKLSLREKIGKEYISIIADEVNVKMVEVGARIKEEISLDITITPELKKEGDARDLMRGIQDLRKKHGLTPQDKIEARISVDDAGKEFLKEFASEIKKATGLSGIVIAKDVKGEEVKAGAMRFVVNLIKS